MRVAALARYSLEDEASVLCGQYHRAEGGDQEGTGGEGDIGIKEYARKERGFVQEQEDKEEVEQGREANSEESENVKE